MKNPLDEKSILEDRLVFKQFINGIENAFGAYKLGSSLNRTYLNCNFKEKQITDGERKILDVIAYERDQLR